MAQLYQLICAILQVLSIFAAEYHQRQSDPEDILGWVDPLIGSQAGGNVFSGATLPYGMAKVFTNSTADDHAAVADVDGENTGGFSTDGSNVTGFSALHDSGTGGNPSLGNFPIFPQLCPTDDINTCKFPIGARATRYNNDTVKARPGYFGVTLESGIQADMAVSQHAALFRFDFSQASSSNTSVDPVILLDLTDLWASRQNASISIEANSGEEAGRMKGNGTFLPSFGAGSYQAYFCLDMSGGTIKDSGVWVNDRAGIEPKKLYVTRGFNLFFLQAGGFIRFQGPLTSPLLARMGISFISTSQACRNAEREIPSFDFNTLIHTAEDAWRAKLSPISITPGATDPSYQTTFWSAVYRTMISPQDYTSENPHWTSSEPYFDSFYCLWDMWRAQLPFLTIIDPDTLSKMLRSLLDTYKHRGWLPDCTMSTCSGWTQGGSNADNALVDAYAKNISGIDWTLAYAAILNDAENEPLEWSIQGRGGLTSWKTLGYIPYLDFDPVGFGTNSRSISRTLEYAYNDFNLGVLARGLGMNTSTKYLARGMNWRNIFNPSQQSTITTNNVTQTFTTLPQPRYANGTWGYQDPLACSPLTSFCSLTSNPSETFESSVWEYQFFVPHDIGGLIQLLGGDESFLARWDAFFKSGLAEIGNEPVFLSVFVPHYAGRPGLSTKRVHEYIPSLFNSTRPGLPGNDDSGALSSFTLFSLLGLFPNPGQSLYLITAPFFPRISITHPLTNATATIRAFNFDAGYENIYVQSARMNGAEWTRNWVGHEFFLQGWTLEVVLGREESEWGRGVGDRPPSMSTGMGYGEV